MTYESVSANARLYRLAPDDPEPVARRLWAIAAGRVVDELTGGPPGAPLTIVAREPALTVHAFADGAFYVVARPWDRFPPLRAASYELHLDIRAPGYLPQPLALSVPTYQRHVVAPAPAAGATQLALDDASGLAAGQRLLLGPDDGSQEYAVLASVGPGPGQVTLQAPLRHAHPVGAAVAVDAYATLALDDVALRREAVTIRGRAFRRDDQTNAVLPVAGATIAVSDFWRSLPALRAMQPGAMTDPDPLQRRFPLAVAPGLHAARAAAASIAARALPAAPDGDKLLCEPCPAGALEVRVSNRLDLGPGSLLRIDPGQGDDAEVMTVLDVYGEGGADEPARLVLELPLRRAHAAGIRVQRLLPGAPAPAASLREAAEAGDRCVFVDDAAGLDATGFVRVATGAPDDHLHAAAARAVSDADGYFRLPPLQRMAALVFSATAPASTPVTVSFQPDYSRRENWLDVVFT